MNKIKAIVLDVDGVIVGDKAGFNAPYPPTEVINKLKQMREKGIYVILCSAKPYYSVKKIVDDAQLNNIQTALAGAILIDPSNLTVVKKHVIENNIATGLTKKILDNNIYTEIYMTDKYFIQKSQKNEITKLHNFTLSFEPIMVNDLINQIKKSKIIKIMNPNDSNRRKISCCSCGRTAISILEPSKGGIGIRLKAPNIILILANSDNTEDKIE